MRKLVPVAVILFLAFPLLAQEHHLEAPWDKTERLAKQAQDSDDQHLLDLANHTVHTYGVPKVVADQFRSALVQAEKRYRAGGPGVTEEELVQFHNHVADVLDLPQHSRVDQKQLRMLRMDMIRSEPTMMGGLTKEQGHKAKEVSHTLSPMQGAYLLSAMTFQKIANPFFQMHPREWDQEKGKKALKTADHAENQHSNPEGADLIHKIQTGAANLSVVDGLKLIRETQKTFKLGGGK